MDAHVELVDHVPLFSLMGTKQKRRLATQLKHQTVAQGKHVTEQGDHGRDFYVIVSGRARCEVDGREIRTFGPGTFFGELSLLAGGRRSATLIAESPMDLLVLDRSDFTMLMREEPYVAVKILASLAARLQDSDHQGLLSDRVHR